MCAMCKLGELEECCAPDVRLRTRFFFKLKREARLSDDILRFFKVVLRDTVGLVLLWPWFDLRIVHDVIIFMTNNLGVRVASSALCFRGHILIK